MVNWLMDDRHFSEKLRGFASGPKHICNYRVTFATEYCENSQQIISRHFKQMMVIFYRGSPTSIICLQNLDTVNNELDIWFHLSYSTHLYHSQFPHTLCVTLRSFAILALSLAILLVYDRPSAIALHLVNC